MTHATVSRSEARRPLVLALDFGTSSLRSQIHDRQGRPVADTLVRRSYRWQVDASGAAWTDAVELLDRIDRLLDETVSRHADLLADVAVAGSSCLFHTFCGVDADRRPITSLRSWADVSAIRAAEQLAGELDVDAVRRRTGAPLHPGYWPARIASSANVRDARHAGWAGLPELVHHRLTGEWGVGRSLAAGTGLRDQDADRWDEELCERLGVEAEQLPPVFTELRLAPTGDRAAARWPALRSLRWLPPVGDGVCSNVGLGATGPETAALMIGTSSALRMVLGAVPNELGPGLFRYGIEDGTVLVGGALSEGGGSVTWWSELVGRDPGSLGSEVGGATGVVMLPYLSGERGPGYHARAYGTVAGLRGADGAGTILRALMTAVALGLAELDAALGSPPRVLATGGALRRSPTWQRIIAAALGRPIELADAPEPSLRGAALLALRALAVPPETPVTATRRIEPQAAELEAVREAAAVRRRLYERLVN